MEWKVFPTGISELDSMLGGGLLDDSVLLVTYDMHSFGWVLAVKVFKSLVDRNGFGVVTNYSLPYSLLAKYSGLAGFTLDDAGREGRLAIIDVFGAVNNVKIDRPYVFYPSGLDASTFLPKMVNMYYRILEHLGDRKPIGITIGIDGFASLFDEETVIRLFRRNMIMKERAKFTEERKRPINIMLLNKDRVSKSFISWISHYSEHIIDFEPTRKPGLERIIVRKSLLPEFEPSTAEFVYSRGEIKIRNIERV